jgi:hypothetical protein
VSAQQIVGRHRVDENGNPAGGATKGIGIFISWQDGPLNRGAERIEPNGAFVEGVIAAALDRMEFYQDSKFACHDNAMVIECLKNALLWCEHRTADREQREVEGTHSL